MNPFIEIALWALVLMVVPFSIELISLKRLVNKDMRKYFYIICGVRRGANFAIFISLIYLIGNLILPVVILLLIEILIGVLLYRKIIKEITIKKLLINVSIFSLISWTIVYGIFRLGFMNLN